MRRPTLVVEGVVEASTRGKTIQVDGVDGAPMETVLFFTNLEIEVETTFWGGWSDRVTVRALSLEDQPAFVKAHAFPFQSSSAFFANGARLVLFLEALADGTYRLLNRQSAVLIGAEVEVSDQESVLAVAWTGRTGTSFRDALSSAAEAVREGPPAVNPGR